MVPSHFQDISALNPAPQDHEFFLGFLPLPGPYISSYLEDMKTRRFGYDFFNVLKILLTLDTCL